MNLIKGGISFDLKEHTALLNWLRVLTMVSFCIVSYRLSSIINPRYLYYLRIGYPLILVALPYFVLPSTLSWRMADLSLFTAILYSWVHVSMMSMA